MDILEYELRSKNKRYLIKHVNHDEKLIEIKEIKVFCR